MSADMDAQLRDCQDDSADVQHFWSQLKSAKHVEEWQAALAGKRDDLQDLAKVEAALKEDRSRKRAKLEAHRVQMEHIARDQNDAMEDRKRKFEHIRVLAEEEQAMRDGSADVQKRMKMAIEKENAVKQTRAKLGLQHQFTNIVFNSLEGDHIEGNTTNVENEDPQYFRITSRPHSVAAADELWGLIRR